MVEPNSFSAALSPTNEIRRVSRFSSCARGRKACKVAVTKLREGRKINSNPEKGAVGMGLDISPQTEARVRQEAQTARHIG